MHQLLMWRAGAADEEVHQRLPACVLKARMMQVVT